MSGRTRELLDAAAETLEDMSDPLATAWLVEHQVDVNEMFDLVDEIAQAIRAWVVIKDNTPLLGAVIAQMSGCGSEIANAMFLSAMQSDTIKKLEAL